MSNTKDTPMDYKHEECSKALRCLYIAVDEVVAADVDNKVSAYVHELKLELQKQKELNAELVKVVTDINNEYTLFNKRISDKNIYAIKSLIKKSSEI